MSYNSSSMNPTRGDCRILAPFGLVWTTILFFHFFCCRSAFFSLGLVINIVIRVRKATVA
jgi:hypothetical protein